MKHKEKPNFYKNFLNAYKENIFKQKINFDFEFEANNKLYLAKFNIYNMFTIYRLLNNKHVKILVKRLNTFNSLVVERSTKEEIIINGLKTNIYIDYFDSNVLNIIRQHNTYHHIYNLINVTAKVNKFKKIYLKDKSTPLFFLTIKYNMIPIFLELFETKPIAKHILIEYEDICSKYIAHIRLSI